MVTKFTALLCKNIAGYKKINIVISKQRSSTRTLDLRWVYNFDSIMLEIIFDCVVLGASNAVHGRHGRQIKDLYIFQEESNEKKLLTNKKTSSINLIM
jgi:hypothetical protein